MPHVAVLFVLFVFGSVGLQSVRASYRKPRSGLSERLNAFIRPKILEPPANLEARQDTHAKSTCGYVTGDPNKPRAGDFGIACRVDTKHAIWGFCPETVIQASDCGLAGACVDLHSCSSTCGVLDDTKVTTFSCIAEGQDFCFTALLTAGPDQTYSYIACATQAGTEHLLASPTSSTESSTPRATPSSRPRSSPFSPSSTSSSVSSFPTKPTPSSTTVLSPGPLPSNPNIPDAPNTPTPPTNNTGAIVGGVIGGLAFICFVAFAVLVLRRLKSFRANVSLNTSSFWRPENQKAEPTTGHPSEQANQQNENIYLTKLSAETHPSEMTSGRRYESHELYSQHSEAVCN